MKRIVLIRFSVYGHAFFFIAREEKYTIQPAVCQFENKRSRRLQRSGLFSCRQSVKLVTGCTLIALCGSCLQDSGKAIMVQTSKDDCSSYTAMTFVKKLRMFKLACGS